MPSEIHEIWRTCPALNVLLQSIAQADRRQLVEKNPRVNFAAKFLRDRPVGWRTRGSATIEPGLSGDPSSRIVLQKGGIKTREYNDLEAENDYIVRLFFERTPSDTIKYTVLLSVRDMIRHDAGFIFTSIEKTLRMEFDWKRRPHLPSDEHVAFSGKDYIHLAFETRPLESVTEFERYRSAMATLSKRRPTCMKTSADLDIFIALAETQKLPNNVGSYISRVDGDLRRLRRDLCRAFYANAAGFAEAKRRFEEQDESKLTARRLAEIITACGIACSKDQTDYGKRAPFEPNQVINTPAAREAFKRIKQHLFELEEVLFFVK